MSHTKIAACSPFEGAPLINSPEVHGASRSKEIIFRIPVTGSRPMKISAAGLPQGLQCDKKGVIRGKIDADGEYSVTLRAENELGTAEKKITFLIGENKLLQTPLLGFTTWNAFASSVTQNDVLETARLMEEQGFFEYGYSYINLDSAWQGEYGGKYDAITANEKFPDMSLMCRRLHESGLKAGIYSTPMLRAWGCPADREYLPGCTTGEADIRFPDQNTGIGVVRKEKNNVKQWQEWGFDYLKYDWCPTDAYNAEEMRRALAEADRDFGYCVTVRIIPESKNYWGKYVNSFRAGNDCDGTWRTLMIIYNSFLAHRTIMQPGHFLDLDMLEIGHGNIYRQMFGEGHEASELSEDEIITAYSMRAFFNSPIQISAKIDKLSDFERSVLCNEEIIAINQDKNAETPFMIYMREAGNSKVHAYRKNLSDGGFAVAVFNLGETESQTELCFEREVQIRDSWAKSDIKTAKSLIVKLAPHAVNIFRMK